MDTVALGFSQEEVVFILGILRSDFIPGLGRPPLGGATLDQARVAMAGAERSLIARGLLSVEPNQPVVVESIALVMIGTCAYPKYSLLLNFERDGQNEAHYFHIGERNLGVEHTVPENGIHIFKAFKDIHDTLEQVAIELGANDQPTPAGSEVKVNQSQLAIARDLIASDATARAAQMMAANGADQPTAAAFTEALANLDATVTILMIKHGDEPNMHLERYTLLMTRGKGFWLASGMPDESQDGTMSFRPTASADLRALLGKQLVAELASAA